MQMVKCKSVAREWHAGAEGGNVLEFIVRVKDLGERLH